MSDDSPEQKIKHIEDLAEKAGVRLKPETIEGLRRKLQDEQRQLEEIRKQYPDGIPEPDWIKVLEQKNQGASQPSGEQGQFSQPPAVGERSAAERAESGSEKKDREIFALRRRLEQTSNDSSAEKNSEKDKEHRRYGAERRLHKA